MIRTEIPPSPPLSSSFPPSMRVPRVWVVLGMLGVGLFSGWSAEFHVGPEGRDDGPGTKEAPLRTLGRARDLARAFAGREPVTIHLLEGVHYLPETLVFTAEDSGTAEAPVVWQAAEGGGRPVISGGVPLRIDWQPARDREGVLEGRVPEGLEIDQLYLDGVALPMARYPNHDPAVRHFNGFAADAFSPERVSRWSDPAGGFLHAMHRHEWGDFHYRILGKDADGALRFEGGWQNNRRLGMHDRYRMVEHVLEELDAPGEWFHDRRGRRLLMIPPAGVDVSKAVLEAVRLRHLVELRGTRRRPVRFVTFRGLAFRHAARTFMDNREPLLRSDWTTYRGGALVFEGTEDCGLRDATVSEVGGNAVFVTGYNRRVVVESCHITRAGANGVAFVGEPGAVRNPLFEYGERQRLSDLDLAPGPKSEDYPADCRVEDCLIHLTGRVEKQTAPVQIAMARRITVRHCSIHDVPRAGINIGDGTWGGHVIEFCDVFDTVLETGDHGSFNSWGRDRYWELRDLDSNRLTDGPHWRLPLLDAVEPVILRNNRWRCDHGWDIDLDDGSSNYEIRDNLCLNGGIKLREGFYRTCENNIMVGNSFHPHVWYRGSEDAFRRNIVFDTYKPIRVPTPWGRECDANLLHVAGMAPALAATALQKQSGRDARSLAGDALFVDPAAGDYRVREGSPALELGFRNFPMNRFGVRTPWLRALARTPRLPAVAGAGPGTGQGEAVRLRWFGAVLRDLASREEASAVGVGLDVGGVLVVEVPRDSRASRLGLEPMDLVQSFHWKPVRRAADFEELLKDHSGGAELGVRRRQQDITLSVEGPVERAVRVQRPAGDR
jgi:hypothetical protein